MDATCNVQDSIHVFHLVHNMCPGFWVHIKLGFGDFYFFTSIEKINHLTEVETTSFDQQN